MQLRDYQSDTIGRARKSYASGAHAPLICAPTGSGKTVMISHITESAVAKGKRSWIIAHRKELIQQASRTLDNFGIQHGIVKAGIPMDPGVSAQVCSIQSLIARMGQLPDPDFILIDECHHAVSGSYRKLIDAYPKAKLLGFTATPARLDGRGLGEVFDAIVMGPTVAELVMRGFLSEARYFAPPQVADLTGIRKRAGDYAKGEAEAAMMKPRIIGDAVEHYQKFADGKPALVFCVSVAHAEAVAAAYGAEGYRAASVDGSMKDADREDRIEGLADGRWQVVTSCDLIGEGLDVPVCTVAQLLRPTASLGLYLQQVGRVLRPADNKPHAIILDHVGNVARHGFAEMDREWSLDPKAKRNVNVQAEPIRNCPECFCSHNPAPICPFCGFEYPAAEGRHIEQVDGELAEIRRQEIAKEKRKEEGRAQSFDDFVALGKERGYKNPVGWARHRARARGYRIA